MSNTMPSLPLKYLFVAEFTDGTSYLQNPEDRSHIEPEHRNCYYDVLQSGKSIRRWILVNQENQRDTLSVDLETGLFAINGLSFMLESEKLPGMPDKFTLIWYHQVTQNQNVTFDKQSGKVLKREHMPEFREYFIGWQCSINGRNYQQKIGVA